MERACKEVLPGLLTEEELKIVPDILTHYLRCRWRSRTHSELYSLTKNVSLKVILNEKLSK